MPKTLKGGATIPRKSALWVQEYYHSTAGFCARALGLSVGEFIEQAIDHFIDTHKELAPLKPALKSMKEALTEAGKISRRMENED